MSEPVKSIRKYYLIYAVVLIVSNFIGSIIPSVNNVPVMNSESNLEWLNFIGGHRSIINLLSFSSFIVPTFLCIMYTRCNDKEQQMRRFINTPLAYSLIGTIGWVIYFIFDVATLLYAKAQYGISVGSIVFSSGLYVFQEGLFIFTFAFLIIDNIHRRFVLPKLFPEGNLSRYKIVLKPSVHFLFVIFYISIGLFPVFYLTSTLLTLHTNYSIPVSNDVLFVLCFILLFGLTILIIFTHYFATPLRKLKEGTEKVKAGDYTHRVDIVSNDSFGELADTFNDMILSLDQKTKKIYAIQDSVIRGMAVMVESRDNSTGGHINRTSDCVKIFVKRLKETPEYKNLTESFCKAMVKAAPMHDLGKIAVDDAILRKPGKFTDEEYEIMKKHSAEGAKIVENVVREVDDEEFKKIAINVAHYHHEKWNGTGYPEKISGENIPFEARIMALADVFDALVSKRCYKDSFTYDKAFSIIEESLGSHFDPVLGKIFIECRPELQDLYESYNN